MGATGLRGVLKDLLQISGKSDRKVVAVFGCEDAVGYVRRGAPETAIWYFAVAPPEPEIAAQCERVFVEPDAVRLLEIAQKELWSVTVALSVANWDGGNGAWRVKLAPLLIPPFRTLFRNENGDYFPGTPGRILAHLRERVKFRLSSGNRGVIAVIACEDGVRYARQEAPATPIWYYGIEPPSSGTALLCGRVCVECDARKLIGLAMVQLSTVPVARCLTAWHGSGGPWALKLGPFLISPFRALIHNESGGIFVPTPSAVARHVLRRVLDAATSGATRAGHWRDGLSLLFFRAVPLAAASAAVRWLGFAFRYAFERLHGGEFLALDAGAPQGEGVTKCRYRQYQWRPGELERAVRVSTSRWILLLDGDAEANAEDLMAPFDDPRTFAVSRQVGYSDWRRETFPTAPFRALQAGEFSQTLAPVSDAILVDRAKLQALGVPRTFAPGTALLMLFWQAAAAGWRSYAMGGARPVKPSAHWPFEDAEFITRALSDPRLRTLGPREPDLARGSIAQDRLPLPVRASRTRVLVVSPYLPYPLSHGGAVRIYNLCRALAGEVDFLLACFLEKGDRADYGKLHEVFREVYTVDRDEQPGHDLALPLQVREHESRSMNALVAALCRERKPDILQVEYTHMARFREAAPGIPSILVEHDLTFSLYRQYAAADPSPLRTAEYERWLQFERRCFREYGSVWVMSEEDRLCAIAEGSSPAATVCVPNGADTSRFVPAGEPAATPEVLYVGSFRHKPNVIGFEKVFGEVMPRVWRRFPEARLRVVAGPDHTRYRREVAHPLVEVHGFVEDLRPLYANASVVVVPLLVSAGTNIKVMEAMAAGKPVVATSPGCAGLGLRDGHDILVRDDFSAFADAVGSLLEDREMGAAIARNARRTVEARFSWEAISRGALESYEQLMGAHAR